MGKKRKLSHPKDHSSEPVTNKPSAVFVPTGGCSSTVSVAIPGSIIAKAKSHEQKNHLVGTIARALAVFSVDEIVIFNDGDGPATDIYNQEPDPSSGKYESYTGFEYPSYFLHHVLSYLETPPYLRRSLFPMHPDLAITGTLPSLDMPHHSKDLPGCPYREGVTIETSASPEGTYVDVGLGQNSQVFLPEVVIPPGTRVTVQYNEDHHHHRDKNTSAGTATPVSPTAPRTALGYYWGYSIRLCDSLSTVFTECPYDNGYDLSIGTSERGLPLSSIMSASASSTTASPLAYTHLLLAIGGPTGLETAAKFDKELQEKGIGARNVGDLFDYWVNFLPGPGAQGSKTIRSEEAVWLALMGIQGLVRGE